jgi:hypothetical protein
MFIGFPELFYEIENIVWSPDLGVSEFGLRRQGKCGQIGHERSTTNVIAGTHVVVHPLWLTQAHSDAFFFVVKASFPTSFFPLVVVFDTSIYQIIVKLLLVTQRIVGGDIRVVHWEGLLFIYFGNCIKMEK